MSTKRIIERQNNNQGPALKWSGRADRLLFAILRCSLVHNLPNRYLAQQTNSEMLCSCLLPRLECLCLAAFVAYKWCQLTAPEGVLSEHRIHCGPGFVDRDGAVGSRREPQGGPHAQRSSAMQSLGTAGQSVTTMLTTLSLALIGGAQVVYGAGAPARAPGPGRERERSEARAGQRRSRGLCS